MIFQLDIDIPPLTVRGLPLRTVLPVAPGRIVEFQYYFRPGAGGFCGWRGFHQEIQRWPYTPDEFFPSVRGLVRWAEDYPLEGEPYELVIEAYNEDDTYPHRLWLAFNVLTVDVTDRAAELAAWLAGGRRVR